MGSTGEPERKRRHLNSISPTAKKQPPAPSSDEKKVDATVLQYQNQKLAQQLEAQRSEYHALESKFNQLKNKQAKYDDTLIVINRAWKELVDDLELLSIRAGGCTNGVKVLDLSQTLEDGKGGSCPPEETFLCRILEASTMESKVPNASVNDVENGLMTRRASTLKIMEYLLKAIDDQRAKNEELSSILRERLAEDEVSKQFQSNHDNLREEVKNLRAAMDAHHLKHKQYSNEVQILQDSHAKDQSEIKRLMGELEETMAELEESKYKLACLKSQRDASLGASFPNLHLGNKNDLDKSGDKSRKLREIEAALEELKTLAENRLAELQEAHQEKLKISQQMDHMQDSLNNGKHILSSRPYLLLNDQLQRLKAEVDRYQSEVESLQAERDRLLHREKEMNLKLESSEVSRRAAAVADARIAELELDLRECMTERNLFETRLEEALRESGRKDTISEFKVMVSTLHKEMGMMQAHLTKFKETACEVHSLRAEVHSLTTILNRNSNEYKKLSDKFADHAAKIKSLQALVTDLRETEQELKLILEMYGRETTDSRDVMEARQAECKAWAQVHKLKSALDEHSLELRVKAANEAEAVCQQRLAVAEAEIADSRQKLDAAERDILEFTEALKAKNEEGEAYMAEIETIGQAYEDMQTQNQRLLQQITERDDYNIKLVSESVKAKQVQNSLLMEKQDMAKQLQQAGASAEMYKQKIMRLEEQVRVYLDQIGKVTEDGRQYALNLDSTKRKLVDVEKESQSLKACLEAVQKESEQCKHRITDLQVELKNERFGKKRIEEELVALNTKFTCLSSLNDGETAAERLQEEIKEYKAILKCSVCHDRPKEVVITKCFHLFCGPCIQRNLETRHRKCPGCGTGFGQNDVRTVYI
jgi:E3 ubiquitin-protein ligase BRE1